MDAGPIRSTARNLRLGAERARFELWAERLDARLRRAGGRLELDAPHGARFHELPRVEVLPYGDGGGAFTLRLGRHVQLGRGLIIEIWGAAQTALELGDEVTFQAGTRARVWGGSIRIGPQARIRDYCFLDATGQLTLGGGVQIGTQVALHAAQRVEIGDNVTIGERTSFFDSDHRHDGSDDAVIDQPRDRADRRRGQRVHRRQLARVAGGEHRRQREHRGRERRAPR